MHLVSLGAARLPLEAPLVALDPLLLTPSVCVCVLGRERVRVRECVFVCERVGESERGCVFVCARACVRAGEAGSAAALPQRGITR